MLNGLIHSLITFIDLAALSSVIGTILCLHWTLCPVCVGEEPLVNPCFDRCRRMLYYCLAGLTATSLAILVHRTMEMAGVGISEVSPFIPVVLFKSHYGSMWIIRIGSILLSWITLQLGKRRLDSGLVIMVLFSACAAIAFARSAASHAADYGDLSFQQITDWFHLMSATSWGGALIAVSLMLSVSDVSNSSEQQHIVAGMADRFYRFFGPVFAILVASGIYNSWIEVRSFGALLTTPYGLFLSVKLLVFAYLTWRYVAPPQRGKDESAYSIEFLRRTRVEALLVLSILFSVALFTHEVPARHAVHLKLLERESRLETAPERGSGQAAGQHDLKDKAQRLSKTSDNGIFSVALLTRDKDLKVGVNSFDIVVNDKSGKGVTGAEITIVPWMPDMGHGVFEKPVVTEKGDGTYGVENVLPIMSGHWELRMKIKKNNTEDNVTFQINVSSEGN